MKRFCLLLLTVLLLVGCGPRIPMTTLSGTISYKGKPVENGIIEFVSETDGSSWSAQITGGNYNLELPAGKCTVRIQAFRVTGTRKLYADMPDSPTEEITEQILPASWNVKSEITCELAKGTQTFDYSGKK